MEITQADLLIDEKVIVSKSANAVIKLTEDGLSQFAFDKYMWTVGMKEKEVMGGKLHLTNFRLIFKSHPLNRLKGKFSIFLPTIKTIRDSSFLMTKKVSIETKFSQFEFVIWQIPTFISEVEAARAKLTKDDVANIQANVLKNYDKCGEGLEIFGGLETLNKIFLTANKARDLFELATNPFEAIGAMALEELLDRTIIESWQKNFE